MHVKSLMLASILFRLLSDKMEMINRFQRSYRISLYSLFNILQFNGSFIPCLRGSASLKAATPFPHTLIERASSAKCSLEWSCESKINRHHLFFGSGRARIGIVVSVLHLLSLSDLYRDGSSHALPSGHMQATSSHSTSTWEGDTP